MGFKRLKMQLYHIFSATEFNDRFQHFNVANDFNKGFVDGLRETCSLPDLAQNKQYKKGYEEGRQTRKEIKQD